MSIEIRNRANLADIVPSDGRVDGAGMGPMSSEQQLKKVEGLVARAKQVDVTISAGGHRIITPSGGYVVLPTILSGCTAQMEAAREQISGPVLFPRGSPAICERK